MTTLKNLYGVMNNTGIISGKKNKPEKKVKLKMRDQKIHSLQELRDNFDADVILKKYKNGKLVKWLQQHYYEAEAEAVCMIDGNSGNPLEELCSALGVPYSPMKYMSEIDKENFLAKKKTLESITSDADILEHAHLAALNQDELAVLIDLGETTIYLCENTFRIPITKDNMKYIGVGKVMIENAFTRQQYERAGIIVEGIDLPEEENPDTIEIARNAAIEHGYDDFADNHSALATKYHEALKTEPLEFYCQLPFDSSPAGNLYTSRSTCYNAAKSSITKAYTAANEYFNPESKKSLSRECAKYYSNVISSAFENKMPEIKEICRNAHKMDSYENICKLVNKAKNKLKKVYDKELIEDADFYEMYNFNYFMEQVDIEELDNSICEDDDFLGQVIEAIFSDPKQYMITDLYPSIREMESDVEDRAATFNKFAHREYVKYVGKIEKVLEELGSIGTETD